MRARCNQAVSTIQKHSILPLFSGTLDERKERAKGRKSEIRNISRNQTEMGKLTRVDEK